jgi:hypothetical protein
MFDFIKPEVNGLKNVLNAYFAFKNQQGIRGDVPEDRMLEFAYYYYGIRLGGAKSQTAIAELNRYLASGHSSNVTIVSVLLGLLAAEGMGGVNPNTVAMGKVFNKFPNIDPHIRGL